jgi:hypothetical protein
MRERRGTTPLAALTRDRSTTAVTGLPVRFYWALPFLGVELFFRRLPGDSRINADAPILRLAPSQLSGGPMRQAASGNDL